MIATPRFLLILIVMSLFQASGQIVPPQWFKFDNSSVITAAQGGVPEEVILKLIQSQDNDARYAIGPDELAQMKKAGVSNRIIQAMITRMNTRPQQLETFPEPEKEATYYFYEATTQSLIPLAPELGTMKNKNKVAGFGGNKTELQLENERSSVHLKQSGSYTFLVRVPAGVVRYQDDNTIAAIAGQLYAFARKNGKRERIVVDSSVRGVPGIAMGVKTTWNSGIPLKVTKAAGNILKIAPDGSLPPGEYGFDASVLRGISMSATQNPDSFLYYSFTIEP